MLIAISNLLPSAVWTIASGFVLTGGDFLLRSWLQTKWPYGFLFTFLVYVLGLLCMMMSFFQQNIAVATVAAVIINVVGYMILAHIFFGDTISLWKGIGIALGLLAFAILELA